MAPLQPLFPYLGVEVLQVISGQVLLNVLGKVPGGQEGGAADTEVKWCKWQFGTPYLFRRELCCS
jgi:hypothetical protein